MFMLNDPISGSHLSLRTQKARGIVALRNAAPHVMSTKAVQQARVYPQEGRPAFPFFARPCPAVPRHGFVDSRMVKTEEEWERMLAEIRAAGEPECEVVCMPFIKAKWSGIVTPTGVSIGPGHDGATSGKGAVMVPAPSLNAKTFSEHFGLPVNEAGIKDSPYVELVVGSSGVEAVQLRDGPSVPLADRYVPKRVQVKEVVLAEGDLLEWEAKAKSFKPGTVVWHPGGTLASHYAVHAVVNGIPILCTEARPEVGAFVDPAAPPSLGPEDYHRLARYFGTLDREMRRLELGKFKVGTYNRFAPLCRPAVASLHAQATWGNEDHLLMLRAFGALATVRLTAMSSLGELRHYNSSGPGAHRGSKMVTALPIVQDGRNHSRTRVQEEAFTLELDELTKHLATAIVDFQTPGWSSSFGGKRWAKCATGALELTRAIAAFMTKPGPKMWARVVEKWNQVIHLAHNSGNILNKFIPDHELDYMSKVPAYGLVSPLMGEVLLERHEPDSEADVAVLAKAISLASVKPKGIKPPRLGKNPMGRSKLTECPAQVKLARGGYLHVQVKLDKAGNRPYGLELYMLAGHPNVSPALVEDLKGSVFPRNLYSLNNDDGKTGKRYAAATMVMGRGKATLKVGPYQVNLTKQAEDAWSDAEAEEGDNHEHDHDCGGGNCGDDCCGSCCSECN